MRYYTELQQRTLVSEMSCISHLFVTYNRITKSMYETENCVSVHLLSAASSSVSSTEGKGKGTGTSTACLGLLDRGEEI